MPVIPSPWRLRQEDSHVVQVSLMIGVGCAESKLSVVSFLSFKELKKIRCDFSVAVIEYQD